jgi:hypothetical protein
MRGWHLCLLSVASAASAAAFHAPPNLPVAVPGNHQGLRPQCTLRHRAGLRLMLPSRRIGMGRRPSGLLTLALMTFREGDSVEVLFLSLLVGTALAANSKPASLCTLAIPCTR